MKACTQKCCGVTDEMFGGVLRIQASDIHSFFDALACIDVIDRVRIHTL